MESEMLLQLFNVSYSQDEQNSLVNISLELTKGENVVIFGPEKSGVDLICPVIAVIIEDFAGAIFYKGRGVKDFDYVQKHNYRKEIGYLQRDYGLVNNMTVGENISLPLIYHSNLSSAEIGVFVDGLIDELNLNYCKEYRPERLLRSEHLKTAYARAVALDPDLLLIEHPLEGQCILNVQTFLRSLKKRSDIEHKSTIYATYEPRRFLPFSNRFIMLHHGEIVFSGTRDEFMQMDNEYLLQFVVSSTEGPMQIL